MTNDIVLGYDGTDGARAALTAALDLAEDLHGRLIVVFSYELSRLGGEVQDLASALREHGDAVLGEASERIGERGREAETLIMEGVVAENLAQTAEERGARAIVVGSYGEHPLKGALVGSTPHKLIQISEVPVLVVPVTRADTPA